MRVLLLLLAVALYLLPSIVANMRRQPQFLAILCLNIFLGWTVLGWIGALIWALTRSSVQISASPQQVATWSWLLLGVGLAIVLLSLVAKVL
jgi:hypothetical protein